MAPIVTPGEMYAFTPKSEPIVRADKPQYFSNMTLPELYSTKAAQGFFNSSDLELKLGGGTGTGWSAPSKPKPQDDANPPYQVQNVHYGLK